MAKTILQPVGSDLSTIVSPDDYAANRAAMEAAEKPILEGREDVHGGWGREYVERVHKKGKLTAWERIEFLKDPGSRVFPINTFVNYGIEFEGGKTSPGAGVVTAFVRVEGKYTVVIANDNTVASGAWWPLTPEKIERSQTIALKLRLPVVYLVDCSGLFLPEQARSFPGPTGAGHIFKMNSLLSAEHVPKHLARHHHGGILHADGVELLVRPFEIPGKTKQLCQQASLADIGRALLDIGQRGGNRLLELAHLVEFLGVHGFLSFSQGDG